MLHLAQTFLQTFPGTPVSLAHPAALHQKLDHSRHKMVCCKSTKLAMMVILQMMAIYQFKFEDLQLSFSSLLSLFFYLEAPSVWQCATSNRELGLPTGRDTAPPIQPSLGKTFLSQTIIYGQSKTEQKLCRYKYDFIRIRSCSNNSLSSRFYQEAPAPQLQTIQWPERFLTN